MASKRRNKGPGSRSAVPASRGRAAPAATNRNRLYLAIAGGALALLAVFAIAFVALGGGGSNAAPNLSTGQTRSSRARGANGPTSRRTGWPR